jgi:hypothetical protein
MSESHEKGPRLVEWAVKELVRVGLFDRDADYDGQLGVDITELMIVFSKQGHSGESADIVLEAFHTLAQRLPL